MSAGIRIVPKAARCPGLEPTPNGTNDWWDDIAPVLHLCQKAAEFNDERLRHKR